MSLGQTASAPRLCMAHGHARQQLQRRVVCDLAVLDDSTVAVRRVRAETHVGEQQQLGEARPQRPQSLLHDTVLGPGAGRLVVLLLGHAEQQQSGHARQGQRLRFAQQTVDGVTAECRQLSFTSGSGATNTGITRSCTLNRVSRTSSRSAGERRSRRRRMAGKLTPKDYALNLLNSPRRACRPIGASRRT